MANPATAKNAEFDEVFDNECFEHLGAALQGAGLARIAAALDDFFRAQGTDRKWRKPKTALRNLALVELSRQVVNRALETFDESPDWYGAKTQIFEIAEIVILHVDNPIEASWSDPNFVGLTLTAGATDRHLASLDRMRALGTHMPHVC